MLSRRTFLKSSPLIALGPTVPGFLLRTARAARPERDGRILVVIQLDGGNDAINTLVPFGDDGYAKHRTTLKISQKDLIRVNDQVGLHPGLRGLARLLARRPDGIFMSDFEQGEIGPNLFRAACNMGLEGLVSKHRDRPYRGGRQKFWIKVKNRKHPAMGRVLDSFR